MHKEKTVNIKIWGIVQGVGFRPFVAKLADRLAIKGEVRNLGGLVEITVTDTPKRIECFTVLLKEEKPKPAEIVHIRVDETEPRVFSCFTIMDSGEGDDEAAMIPADIAVCDDCMREFLDKDDPRYLHPFISCMACGPRYTIIDRIPYDRKNTSMIDFPMCDFCESEYTERNDRRYHAQTISCHDCGPVILLKDELQPASMQEEEQHLSENYFPETRSKDQTFPLIALAARRILEDGVIALKGVGGYYFVCSPFHEQAVKKLRQIKQREEKPFAVMFRDLSDIESFCYVSEEEKRLLSSSSRPIVLLERKDRELKLCYDVCRTSRFIGAFLPSMSLQHMLLDVCGPLVMTSANLSDMPIIKDDAEMFALQEKMAPPSGIDGVFYNERKICVRMDDSVVRVIDGQPQMIRRSKGYAPVPLYINKALQKEDMIYAAGGQLKAAFTLTKGPFAYVSQYFGDLEGMETEQVYREGFEHMKALFRIEPKLAVCDMHPLYYTTRFAEDYAKEHGVPLLKVQHHHAHVASVIAENDLKGPVLGVSFDGTGYGTDGAVWGGEFLLCEGAGFERKAHLEYIKMLGGDSSMKEGWKSAMSYARHCGCESRFEGDPAWPLVQAGLERDINTIKSSSMGRLFDAITSFLGIHNENRYEGECAILLENSAEEALRHASQPYPMDFGYRNTPEGIEILSTPIFRSLEEALSAGTDPRRAALGFHHAAARMILAVCRESGVNQIALTGGVFQNKILMEETLRLLRGAGFEVYYNISVGPNDGGISLGQSWLGMEYLLSQKTKSKI